MSNGPHISTVQRCAACGHLPPPEPHSGSGLPTMTIDLAGAPALLMAVRELRRLSSYLRTEGASPTIGADGIASIITELEMRK